MLADQIVWVGLADLGEPAAQDEQADWPQFPLAQSSAALSYRMEVVRRGIGTPSQKETCNNTS